MLNIFYVSDEDKFHFKGEKGRNLTMKAAAAKLMHKWPERFDKESKAIAFLEDIQANSAIDSGSLKQQKIEENYLDWDALYAMLAERLPILFAISDEANKMVFTVNPAKEVRKISYKTKEELINALQKDAAVWRILKDFYANNELLQAHKHKVSFYQFLQRVAVEHLMLDESKQINPSDIKRISWDADEYAFKKFDLARVQPGEFPTWREFLDRLDYPDVFAAWVWGIVEPYNNIRQAMWLVGQGDDGKSVVMGALKNLLGSQYVKSMQSRELGEKFFLSGVYGKSLVNYADCDEIYLLNNPKIKQITGADTTSIEFKGKDSFTGDVYAKLFITSNKNPKINPESRAQVTRLIRLDVSKPKHQTADFAAGLDAEIWAFLAHCKDCYLAHINEGGNKLNLPEQLQEKIFSLCAAESFSIMTEFFANRVDLGPEYICLVPDFKLALREFAVLEQHIDSSQMRHFVADVEDKLHIGGIKAERQMIDGQMRTVYIGFRLKGPKGKG